MRPRRGSQIAPVSVAREQVLPEPLLSDLGVQLGGLLRDFSRGLWCELLRVVPVSVTRQKLVNLRPDGGLAVCVLDCHGCLPTPSKRNVGIVEPAVVELLSVVRRVAVAEPEPALIGSLLAVADRPPARPRSVAALVFDELLL